MAYLWYVKRRILHNYQQGCSPPSICKLLKKEGTINTMCAGITKFIQKFEQTGLIPSTPGSGRPTKISEEMRAIIKEQMRGRR